jgi:hypothetical protein
MDDKQPLESLDPGRGVPGYWEWFQARVMEEAGPVLDRRLREAHPSVGQLVLSWGRFVVPSALAAATVAWMVASHSPPASVIHDAETRVISADPWSDAFPVAVESPDRSPMPFPTDGL